MKTPSNRDAPKHLELLAQPQAIHAAMEGMVTIDEQMRIIMINPAAQRMFGRTSIETIGLPLDELMPRRYRATHQAHVKRFLESNAIERSMGQSGQLFGLRANGEEFPLEVVICKVELTTAGGPMLCCTALMCDRSKERALSNEIDVLNHQMRAIFESAPIAIWITDCDRIAFANRACGRLFGVEAAHILIGKPIQQLLNLTHIDSDPNSEFGWSDLTATATASEAVQRLPGKIHLPDGTEKNVEIAVTRLPDHAKDLVQMVIVDTTSQIRERRDLLASRRILRDLSASIVDAREEERKSIARELHDELGQRLTTLKIELSSYETGTPRGSEPGRLQAMIDMVDETVAATRRIALGLRPPMLDDLGLAAAIDWLIGEFRRHSTVQVDLRTETYQENVSPAVAVALYRILQEALTNISRHASAQKVQIELSTREQWVQLKVRDDGLGFPDENASPKRASFGLIGMRERVRVLGGQLQLKNSSRGGATIVVRLPMAQDDGATLRHSLEETAPAPDTMPSPLTPWERP